MRYSGTQMRTPLHLCVGRSNVCALCVCSAYFKLCMGFRNLSVYLIVRGAGGYPMSQLVRISCLLFHRLFFFAFPGLLFTCIYSFLHCIFFQMCIAWLRRWMEEFSIQFAYYTIRFDRSHFFDIPYTHIGENEHKIGLIKRV